MDQRNGPPQAGSRRPGLADTDITRLLAAGIGRDGPVLALLAGLAVVVLGPSVFGHVLIGDDWPHAVERGFNIDLALGAGRPLFAATIAFMGADLVAPPVTLAFLLTLWWAGLLAVVRAAGLDRPARFLVMALFTFNPMLAGFLGYETNHMAAGLSVLLCLLAGRLLWLAAEGPARAVTTGGAGPVLRPGDGRAVLAAAALSGLGATGFQQFFVLMPMAVALIAGARLAAGGMVAPRGALRLLALTALASVLGVLCYALLSAGAFALTGAEPLGGAYSVAGGFATEEYQFNALVRRFASAWLQFLFLPQTAVPLVAKLLLLGLMTAIGLAALARLRAGARLTAVMLIALVAILLIGPWLLGLVRLPGVYYYRALASVALAWAGVAALALAAWRHPPGRNVVAIAAGWLLAVFLLNMNASILIQVQTDRRDRAIVSRIVERIERLPGFEAVRRRGIGRIVTVGTLPLAEGKHLEMPPAPAPLDTRDVCGLLTCPSHNNLAAALRAMGSQDVVYEAIRPRDIGPSLAPLARKTLQGMTPWPDDDAIRILESGEILIYLGPAEGR